MDAAVGGAFLSASLQVLFDRLASRDVLTFFQGNQPRAMLLKKLKINLMAVQAVLNDAEAKQIKSSAVKEWVDELKDVIYDAEDLLDDIATDALRWKMESDSQTQVRNIFSTLVNPLVKGITSRAGDINDVLELLAQQKDALGLKEGVGENFLERLPATSLVNDSGVYGRDGNKEEIVQLLLSNNASGSNVSVIALVGMGGIGKTTLANLAYHDVNVKECFELKAWVCVSDEFDIVSITKTILRTLDPTAKDENDLNLLLLKLRDTLNGKKFLLVLDDVWNENYNYWDILQTPLIVGLNGSKIIVTTRSDKVASIMRSDYIHHLKQLSFEDSWSLFAKHAFKNIGGSGPNQRLEKIGKMIVKKCKGLPLAIKTLGSALYSESRVKQWENLLNSEIWDLPNDNILPALRLSYDHLPSQLKRCFAYCCIFPKDYEIEKEKLILLWMAEGFLEQSKGKKMMEEVGYNYFDELLSRSFFQRSTTNKSYFVMHDLISDLAQLVSGKICLQLKDGKLHEIPEKLRHFSYFRSKYDLFDKFESLNNVNGLQTFLPVNLGHLPSYDKDHKVSTYRYEHWPEYSPEFRLSNKVLNDLLSKAKYLRVLSLSCYDIVNFPEAIGNLMHLRYLDLSYTSIRRLPDSICNLYNLQTLILTYCRNLVELPVMMSKLISLRHVDIRHCEVKEMPSQMGELESLRRLTNYRVGKKSGTGIGELRELSYLSGSLHIQDLQVVVDGRQALEANLAGKQYLDDLWLEWKEDYSDMDNGADTVLCNLQPHSNLKTLTIESYRGLRFPDWLGGPEILINMVSLRLWNCSNVSIFPPLGQLPCLKYLCISEADKVERVGAEFYGTGSSSTKPAFVSLKALSFMGMPKWKEWVCRGGEGGELPRLKELYIKYCPELSGELPVHVQLLTKLEITECGEVFLRRPASEFKYLQSMITSNMPQWKELPPLLRTLKIEMDDSAESLLEDGLLESNNCLQHLGIHDCSFSKTLARVCLPITLKILQTVRVKNVEVLLHELFKCSCNSLTSLVIYNCTCSSLTRFLLDNFPKLYNLVIYDLEGLESLSLSVKEGHDPTSLRCLLIKDCRNLASIELPALNLLRYSIRNCCNLKSLVHNAACSFESLEIEDCAELIFPIQGLPSSNLTSLSISKCEQLTSEMELGLQQLTSLQELHIRDCPNLHSLKEEGFPTSLISLTIHNCPLLKDECKLWRSGHRIPHILVDGLLLE